jgi:hypothetical protein
MSSEDFSVTDSSSSWDYDEVVKPPNRLLITGVASVSIGAIWSVICLLDVNGWHEIKAIEPRYVAGFMGYVLTLWVPLFLIVSLRKLQVKHSKENPGGYDSYAGLVMANRLKYLAIIGLVFSLIAIYVAVLPIAEKLAPS